MLVFCEFWYKINMKKIALITGASSGIGNEVALKLIDEGYTVYGAARRTELMNDIVEKGGTALYLNLFDEKSIEECVNTIISKENKIDLLINNAGYGLGGGIEDISIEDAKKQFEVNVFGMIKIIQLVLPSMRKQKSGMIINVASMAGRFSSPFTGWYHASKYSVEALSDALRLEVEPFGIKVVIVEPGLIKTDWGIIHSKNIRKFSGNSEYSKYAKIAADYFEKSYGKKGSITKPTVISDLIIKIAKKKHPKPRYTKGKNAKIFLLIKKIVPDTIFDKLLKIAFYLKK